MKRTLYLSILLGVSILATLGRVYSTFFAKFKDLPTMLTGDAETDAFMIEVASVAKKQYSFATSHLSKLFVIIMIIALSISLFYLFKKDMRAVYSYLVYLVLTLIKAIYSFSASDYFASQYTDKTMQSIVKTEARTSFGLTIVLFLINLLIIWYNNRKKSVGTVSSSGIDL